MYAIVLSFDRQLPFVELMLAQYKRLWLDCPLIFRVPYNDSAPQGLQNQDCVELLKSPKPISETMRVLLQDIDDEDFVFWAIDDRYPVKVQEGVLQMTYEWLLANPDVVDAVRFTTSRISVADDSITYTIANQQFNRQVDGIAHGFYPHHFIRAKYLKQYFLEPNLPENYSIRTFHKYLISLPITSRIATSSKSLIQFAEPSFLNKITINAIADLKAANLPIPDMEIFKAIIIYGDKQKRLSTLRYDWAFVQYLFSQPMSLKGKVHAFSKRTKR
jgi:hypothetical protein